ncbi:MAG: nicotinate (nicotinamide) nucleotide adenylyltransferase [Prolixibacteraceae bacterium]
MKIAIYSGSFNPVHVGHLAIAEAALEQGYDEVWLVVSPQNPHKIDIDLWPFEDRMQMVRLAILNSKQLKAFDFENNLPRPSYTIHTLEYLKKSYPLNQFCLLIGGDNLQTFHLWKSHKEIIETFGLIVYPRSSGDTDQLGNHPNIHRINAPLFEISSSEIRKKLSENQSIHGLVSPEVENYILYKLNNDGSNSD